MSHHIIKAERDGVTLYLIWSTVVDSPITYGGTLDELREHIEDDRGRQGLRELPQRLERVEKHGTSSMLRESLDEYLSVYRGWESDEDDANEGRVGITFDEFWERYCTEEARS